MHISDVVAASGITATALVLQGLVQARFNNASETKRLNHESTERQEDRDRSLADHWRDHRFEAHAQLLAAMDALMSEYQSRTWHIEGTRPELVPPETETTVERAWSAVQLLGSEESIEVGTRMMTEAYRNAKLAAFHIYAIQNERDDRARMKDACDVLANLLAEYQTAARKDIGTES